jgi:dephospho-CoA kinase
MLRIGLTGGLACGKSTVGKMMACRGAHVIEADAIAHQLMAPGQKVYGEVVRLFGPDIVNPSDGTIIRAKLAELAFGGGRVPELNALVHPAVIERQDEWMDALGQSDPDGIAVVEAALILEAQAGKRFDKIVVVTCRPEQKVERYLRRTITADSGPLAEISARKEAQRRMAAQISDEEKIKFADFVIDNSGSLEITERQVDAMMTTLRHAASAAR